MANILSSNLFDSLGTEIIVGLVMLILGGSAAYKLVNRVRIKQKGGDNSTQIASGQNTYIGKKSEESDGR